MARNKIRLYFKLTNGEERIFMNFYQMTSDKSVYFNTLMEGAEVKRVGVIDKEKELLSTAPIASGSKNLKVSVHSSGQVHAKTSEGKLFTKFNIPPLEQLKVPQEICTILPANPFIYSLRKGIRKLDMEIDLCWIKKGSFGVKIYIYKPLPIERAINGISIPLNARFPKGTNGQMIYKEYRGFGFYIFIYQTPKLASSVHDVLEHWFFNRPKNSKKQVEPIIIKGRIYEKDGVKITISKPKIELKKVGDS